MPVNLVLGTDGSNTLNGSAGADLIYGYDPNGPQSQASAIVATGSDRVSQPLFAIARPGDTTRLFIVEKTGQIKIVDLAIGQVLATPFLNVSSQILTDGERGLLGLAFDPNFASNGFFYVYLINTSGDAEIRRYNVSSSNPNVADAASLTPIITIDQTSATNHKTGWIGFGPDGYLYIASGDGAVASNAQTLSNLLGKILRIDVHGDGFPSDPARNYAIPADNPFVTTAGAAGEIFALGLRNPWRDATERTLQIVTDFGTVGNVSSFGEDARGNLYLVDFDGDIFRLTPTVASADQADVLRGFGGNDLLYGGSGNDLLDGGADALIVDHRSAAVKGPLGAVPEADAEQVGICPLATASFRVNDEVLDLKEAIEPEIPISDLFWIQG
jgi:hypothetical protein